MKGRAVGKGEGKQERGNVGKAEGKKYREGMKEGRTVRGRKAREEEGRKVGCNRRKDVAIHTSERSVLTKNIPLSGFSLCTLRGTVNHGWDGLERL